MNDFQLDFSETSVETWKSQIIKELKDDAARIEFTDEIEEICLDITATSQKDNSVAIDNPTNDWNISCSIVVADEKTANQLALTSLNQGSNELIFNLLKSEIDWTNLFNGIEVQYIHTRLKFSNSSQLQSFLASDFSSKLEYFSFDIDAFDSNFESYESSLKSLKSYKVVSVNGFELQQIGATTWQEIGVILSTAHELLNRGFSSKQLSFSIGIGSNYFLEIAKLRALRYLWKQITAAYGTDETMEIVSHVGWSNKSLKDQHTNLLRQTTEGMTAAAGGSDSIVIHAYDELSTDGSSDFAHRMAANISNLLKEESYFNKVQDPLRGSHIVENLTSIIVEKAWANFLELEDYKSISSSEKLEKIKTDIAAKANTRLAKFKENQMKLIGINLFNQESKNAQTWKEELNYLGVPYLIYELG
jgi:methylmalonyl-CoA mutase